MADYELGVIGAGNMAEAILRGVIGSGFLPAGAVVASDVAADRRRRVAAETGVTCTADNLVPAACGRLLLAVKPQVMGAVLAEIATSVRPDALVVSIAAGIGTAFLDGQLGGKGRLVRVMPNTPMLVGSGASAVAAGPRAGADDVAYVCGLFSAGGEAVVVDEAMMDAVTAVSGSGPAYFFYLVEAMVEAGVAEGLPAGVAEKLAGQTCLGAGQLLAETGQRPQALRAAVTSPGGTTQRAIEALDASGVKQRLIEAIRAAARRSRELGA